MSEGWPPDEDTLRKHWVERHYPDHFYIRELPVAEEQPANWFEIGSPKRIDLVLFPKPPESIEEKLQRHIIHTGEGVKFENTETGAELDIDKFRYFIALLKTWPESSFPVRIYEVKDCLDFESLGQILTYTGHFTEYYDIGGTRPSVEERGIIHADDDPIIAETAESYDVELYQVESPN